MISGRSPRQQWRANLDGRARSVGEAVRIARSFGVSIPDDVTFFVDELGWLDERTTARGPRVTKPSGALVGWSDMLNIAGRVPFIVRPDILRSDEAIVAVFTHEMYELAELRPLLEKGSMTIEHYIAETREGNPGNLHERAWDVADAAVEKMRGGTR
ncbi:MAG: hypothetical protein ABR915_00810 [Thermoguttaceae bacterium]|jgi:hypothetical protein